MVGFSVNAPRIQIYMSRAMRKCVLCHMRTTKAQIMDAQADQRLCCSLLR